MAMVRFATLCDVMTKRGCPCHKRSDEYSAWPACRSCGAHVCDEHEPEGTRREMCPSCLESDGPDEFCIAPEDDPRTEAEIRAEREYRELDRGEL